MQYDPPLMAGTLLRRYKRFLADIKLMNGDEVTAHCVNPGAMLDIARPGNPVWVSPVATPSAKLKYRWELEEVDGRLIGVNTRLAEVIGGEAVTAGQIPELAGYRSLRREVRYGKNSRIDLLLEDPDRAPSQCFVEIKNVHLNRNGRALFPDSVTQRGAKHLAELADQVAAGHRAVMLYIVQRDDCAAFSVAYDIDPAYGAAFDAARGQGVEMLAYDCTVAPGGIRLNKALPLAT